MKNTKIKNFKEFIYGICSSNRDFVEKIESEGGANHFLRAFTAQILWLTLFYNIGILLIPVREALLSNAILVVIIAILMMLKSCLKNRIPSWIDAHINGEFFYDFEIEFLNKWITCMLVFNFGLLFVNINLIKEYGRKK